MTDADVLVVGGGIAGLAAALRLKDRGLRPLVLESEPRVGGRMTTDRVKGFAIDRGVTLLGNRFRRMRSLVKRLGIRPLVHPVRFSAGMQEADALRVYRGRKPGDILFASHLSAKAKLAFLKVAWDLVRHSRSLVHGRSDRAGAIDSESARVYMARMGEGGMELFDRIFQPGLDGPVGGSLAEVSRAILMQTAWNLLVNGQWNVRDGVDRIPEAISSQVPVRTRARALEVRVREGGVRVQADFDGRPETLAARSVLFAIPGHLVPALCPDLPDWMSEPLRRTRYSRMASANVALDRPPSTQVAGYALADGTRPGYEMELEHLRAEGRCPAGTGMVSVFMWDTPAFRPVDADDSAIERRAVEAVGRAFPDVAGQARFVHVVRWPAGICQFPAGRLREMIALRSRLEEEPGPVDLCGDYLDGLASEGALRTGEQAADRAARRLAGIAKETPAA